MRPRDRPPDRLMGMRDIADWRLAGLINDDFRLHLNLSPASMRDPGLGQSLAEIAADTGVDPATVVLELSDEADELPTDVIQTLERAGFRFAVDDLGMKRSNFDRLLTGSVEIAKLDRRWIGEPIVLDALIRTCSAHGVNVVVEGIEAMEQLAFIFAHGVRMCQGYLIARPKAASDIVEMLSTGRRATRLTNS